MCSSAGHELKDDAILRVGLVCMLSILTDAAWTSKTASRYTWK